MKMGFLKTRLLTLGACSALLLGCAATTQMTSPSLNAEAKRFMPPSDQAYIYVVRDNRFAGYMVSFQTTLDGRIVGGLAPHTFQLLKVNPGQHVLSAVGEGRPIQHQVINAEPGRMYFFSMHVEMNFPVPGLHLLAMSEESGRLAVTNSNRAEAISY